jgi:hypothetical protein
MRIPKRLHFVWLGTTEMPEMIRECVESWKRIHRLYECKVWTDQDINVENFPLTWPWIKRCKNMAEIKDIIVPEILLLHGGFYIDADMYCLHHLEVFLDPNCTLVVCHEDSSLWQRKHQEDSLLIKDLPCTNAFIGSREGELMFTLMIEAYSNIAWGSHPTNEITGPVFFGKFVTPRIEMDSTVQVLVPQALYEILWNHPAEKIFKWAKQLEDRECAVDKAIQRLSLDHAKRQVLGMHLWCQSWRSLEPLERALDRFENSEKKSIFSLERKLVVVIPFRHQKNNWQRLRNLKMVLEFWKQQTGVHEIVLSEQKIDPRDEGVAEWVDTSKITVFSESTAENFNRSRAFNMGAMHAQSSRQSHYIFADADVLIDDEAIAQISEKLAQDPWTSVNPYERIMDLSESRVLELEARQMQKQVWQNWQEDDEHVVPRLGVNHAGGVFAMSHEMFTLTGGWDESYIGWGKEDEGMLKRIQNAGMFVISSAKNLLKERLGNSIDSARCREWMQRIEPFEKLVVQTQAEQIDVPPESLVFPVTTLPYTAVHLYHK